MRKIFEKFIFSLIFAKKFKKIYTLKKKPVKFYGNLQLQKIPLEIPKTSVKEPAARNTGVLETAGIGREGCDRVGLP